MILYEDDDMKNYNYDEKELLLFEEYAKVFTLPSLCGPTGTNSKLAGKRLGIVNGSSWVSVWSNYFSHKILPEVMRLNVGNDGMQYNFMLAHKNGEACPPEKNIQAMADEAEQLCDLYRVDALICTCSTMNRAYPVVAKRVEKYGIPVVQIDIPLMEQALLTGNSILVIATHGPTVDNTRILLQETAQRLQKKPVIYGVTEESAFEEIASGNIKAHNEIIANAIRASKKKFDFDVVVLAQLSMSVFKLSFPDCEKEFGVPVLTSGECGFERIKEILLSQ